MAKQEILPPLRPESPKPRDVTPPTVTPPSVDTGDILTSALTRWEARYQTHTAEALTERMAAEVKYYDAQKELAEAYVRRQRAFAIVAELPEIIALERAKRRAERAEETRQAQHRHELAEIQRLTEVTHAEATLVDAQQALRAQREFGYTTYELAWRKKFCEMLDVELNAAERLAILRQHIGELAEGRGSRQSLTVDASDEAVEDALYEAQSQLFGAGLDTSRVDAAIQERKSRK